MHGSVLESASPVQSIRKHDNDTWYREYNTTQGRWIKPDPAGLQAVDPTNPQTWNRYVYALNNPLSNIDPTGLFCVWDDGSYDSADDPHTGTASSCGAAGGNWFDGNPFDWGLNRSSSR
jgi:RHS repeat-associated protein